MKIITTIGICLALGLGIYFLGKPSKGKSSSSQANLPSLPFTRVLELERGKWSPPIILGVTRPQIHIDLGVVEDNAPLVVEINGGKKNGGYTYEVPPRTEVPVWEAPRFPNTIIQVRVGLRDGGVKKAHLAYTISQKK